MKTDYWRNMFSKRKDEGASKNDCLSHKNGILPPAVVQASREEIKKFLRGKRVGNYLLGKTVGSGSFARVKQGLHILTGEKVAVKIIDKKLAQEDPYVAKNMRREARLLQMARHPNIIQLLEVVETEHRYYLVTEVALGGDLMDYICYRKRLGEREVRKFMRQVVSAVHYLHQAGIIHRDLKIENLLMDDKFNIKIIDFGLSNILQRDQSDKRSRMEHCQTQCGSPAYAAPEILGHKPYGLEADVWSIGVNMFAMLTGKLPFTAEPFHITTLYNKMKNNEINPLPEAVSSACKDLVWRFLTFDPKKRITLDEAMEHEWIKKGSEEPFLPVSFPNYLIQHQLNHDIIRHMVEKMNLKRATIVGALIQNRATPESTIYHLLQARLERYLQGQPNRRSLHEELLPIDSLQAKALSTNKGSAVTNSKVAEELDTSLGKVTCIETEDHGNGSVVDGIKREENLTDNTERLENKERVIRIDEARILVDSRQTLEFLEKGEEDKNQNILKMEEEKLGENEKADNVFERRDITFDMTQDNPVCEKIDNTQVSSDAVEPNDNPDLSSTQNFGKPSSNVKIISDFEHPSGDSNISGSSFRTSNRDCAAQMSITISSAKSLDSQAMIDDKAYEGKDVALGEETTCSLPKRKRSSARSLEKKSFPSKIPTIKGVSPTRAKIISMPLSPTKVKEEKEKVSETRPSPLPFSRVNFPESVRIPTSRQRDKTPLSLSFTAMVERIAAKANKLKSDEEASTSHRPSKTSREDPPIGSNDDSPVTLRQSGYGMFYQVNTDMKTDSVKEPSPISAVTDDITKQNLLHNLDAPEVELTRPEVVLRPPSPKPISTETDRVTGKDSLHNLDGAEVKPTIAEVEPSQPEVVLRPPSPRPPSSHRYTIPVVQGKDLYKIIIGSTITQVPTTRVRTKAAPKSQSKIPLPIPELSDMELMKEGTGETHNADQLFKLPLSLTKSKRFSLEHVRDLKRQEPPNRISNMVLTYHTKTPAIQPLPLSTQDKNLKSLECSKKSSSHSGEICGGEDVVRRTMLRRNCKDKQDETKDRRRTVHIMDGEYAKPSPQEKVSNSVNSERSNDSSTGNSQTIDEMRTRVRIRTRPRSWIEPSTNRKTAITSSKISVLKFTHRRS